MNQIESSSSSDSDSGNTNISFNNQSDSDDDAKGKKGAYKAGAGGPASSTTNLSSLWQNLNKIKDSQKHGGNA